MLGPLAPHLAEELWIALGNDEPGTQTPWPGVSFRCPHEHPDRTEPAPGSRQRTRSCATGLACHRCDKHYEPLERRCSPARTAARASTSSTTTSWRPATSRTSRAPSARSNIWHFEELLPIIDARAQARVGQLSGYTPLIRADRLGAELGLSNLYLKDDSTSRPSLSYKDRVVSMSVARLLERGKTEIGCVSTGNVGTAVASLAAKAGVDAYVFYPNRLEETKAARCMALGREGLPGRGQLRRSQPPLPRSRRSDRHGVRQHHAAPVLRRGREDGGVRDRRAARLAARRSTSSSPAAGGTLSSRMHKGLSELQLLRPRRDRLDAIHIAQPSGCNPIASAILAEEAEVSR